MQSTKIAKDGVAQLIPCWWPVGCVAEARYHFYEAKREYACI